MILDAAAARVLARELTQRLAGARVQHVLAGDRLSVTLELYSGRRHYLTLTAEPAREGVLLSSDRVRRGAGGMPPLAQALRGLLVGARMTDVTTPPDERILIVTFEAASRLRLIAELTGRMANLLLVDEKDRILAVARPVTAEMTRARVLLPGKPYAAPPAPEKASWSSLDAATMSAALTDAAAQEKTTWRALLGEVRGIGPLLAREVCHRAGLGAQHIPTAAGASADGPRVVAALHELIGMTLEERPLATPSGDAARGEHPADVAASREATATPDPKEDITGLWPCVAYAAEGEKAVAWAPYRIEHLAAENARLEHHAGVIEALTAYDGARRMADGDGDGYTAARDAVRREIKQARSRMERRRNSMRRQLEGVDERALQTLRDKGDLILAYQWQVEPGAQSVVVPDMEGEELRIVLDPSKGPVENAQSYYDRYQRRSRAARRVPVRLARTEAALATLAQWENDLVHADSRTEIDAVRDLVVDSGWLPRPPKKRGPRAKAPREPLALSSSDGLTILVGRNSRQNERVTFERAARGDPWLHARGVPGAHVVVKAAGRPVPERTLLEAAALAAWFSASRDGRGVDVAVTDVRHVRRLKGGGQGMVRFEHGSTLTVDPAAPDVIAGRADEASPADEEE